MARKWKKPKGQAQKPKRRKKRGGAAGGSGSSGGGAMSGLRGGFKSMFGSGGDKGKPKSNLSKLLDLGLWVAVAVAAYLFVSRQCG